jgi:hypothetical protein
MQSRDIGRRITLALVFGTGTWALAENVSQAIAVGVAAGLMAFYLAAVEIRVDRLESPN